MTTKQMIETLTRGTPSEIREAACEMWSRWCSHTGYGYQTAERGARDVARIVRPDLRGSNDVGSWVYGIAYLGRCVSE